ncbi:MAG: hypothetical protein OXI22_06840 [Defluviicoccus sp.]|nr:hypothetical protein [Defluviicoccus sp.]
MRLLKIVTAFVVLLVATPSEAVIGKRPNAPLSSIKNFDPNWVEIHMYKGFETRNPEHVQRVTRLADFVCKLYNRTAVLLTLTQPTGLRLVNGEGQVLSGHIDLYYTFACAIE